MVYATECVQEGMARRIASGSEVGCRRTGRREDVAGEEWLEYHRIDASKTRELLAAREPSRRAASPNR
jgi:hypothetical protein